MIKDLLIGSPEKEGVSSRSIYNFLRDVEKHKLELHTFMLVKNNKVVSSSSYKPFNLRTPHVMWSLSKAFTSTAVGIAVDEGLMNIDEKVISFFPDNLPQKLSKKLEVMTVYHLLTMTTGHEGEFFSENVNQSWAEFFLKTPLKYKPGTHFAYCSLATYMLSAIIQKVTKTTLYNFLDSRVFNPLNITETSWLMNPEGINTGGWGLKTNTETIAKLGLLYLNKGVWNGKRIISENWIEMATQKQVSNGDDPESDWAQGYGFKFWRCKHNCFRGDGAGGQFCIVMPEHNAVFATTSCVNDMQLLLNLIWKNIIPGFSKSPLKNSIRYSKLLNDKIQHLEVAYPKGSEEILFNGSIPGNSYVFDENDLKLSFVKFDFEENRLVTFKFMDGKTYKIKYGYNKWIFEDNKFPFINPAMNITADAYAAGAWKNEKTFILKILCPEFSSCLLSFKFKDDRIIMKFGGMLFSDSKTAKGILIKEQ